MFSARTDWPLTTNRLTQIHRELLEAGAPILDLTISNPTRAGLEYDAASIMASLATPACLDYDPQPKGMSCARQAVADYYQQNHQSVVDPEAIVFTASTSEGYSHIFRLLCDAETEILVPKPSYPLFDFLADLHDVKLVPYSLIYDEGWQIDFPSLRQSISSRTRAVVVVHPNNPTGSFVSDPQRQELIAVCRKHGLSLIVDEVFLDYAHDHARRTFADGSEVLTFTLSGLSKISALPQMKLAWIIVSGPGEEKDAAINRLEIIADTFLSVSTPVQLAAPVLLTQKKSLQPQIMQRVLANRNELDCQLAKPKQNERLKIEGGWYAVLRTPATQPDEDLAIKVLREARVFVHPGHFYDFPTDGYLILSLITPEKDFREGLKRMFKVGPGR